MKLLITHDRGGDWNVWATLPDHDPLHDVYGFVVGVGKSRDAAVADAVAVFEAAIEELQAPPGAVEERALP
jgi:hypothetical protein